MKIVKLNIKFLCITGIFVFLVGSVGVEKVAACSASSVMHGPGTCTSADNYCDDLGGGLVTSCGCSSDGWSFSCKIACSGSCGGGSCFPAGTEVVTAPTATQLGGQVGEWVTKNIEDIEVGDRVFSQDEGGNKIVSTVKELKTPISTNMCEITYTDGDTLRLTDNHAMSTVEGWKAINPEAARAEIPGLSVGQLEEGDEILRVEGGSSEVESYSCWSERQQTYNLELDGSVNTYFADGYLAHNKGGQFCPPGYHQDKTVCVRKCKDGPETCRYRRRKYVCESEEICYCSSDYPCVPNAPPPCTVTSWSSCTASCGGGLETSNCGTLRDCNTQACTITGTVYYDPYNFCSTNEPQNIGGELTTELRGTAYSDTVSAGGTYSIEAPAGSYNYLDLGGIPAGYNCSTGCLQGCPTATSVISPSISNNFFFSDNNEAWWQVVGAGVYAGSTGGGVTIGSELPYSTSRLIIPGTNDLAAIVRASGQVNTGQGEISDENWSVVSPYKGKRMNYRFFANRMGVNPGTTTDFTSGTLNFLEISGDTQDFYYAYDDGDNEVTFTTPWTITSGESYVIFVNSDLRINRDITVEPGGFLFFGVNGSVTVSPSVTTMQGMYVMNDDFTTESLLPADDTQLVVEGMIVTWSNVSLNRSLGGVTNGLFPAEQFVYRTDLLINMPDKLKSFIFNWQEVPAGTFD